MKQLHYITTKALIGWMLNQLALQEELAQAQKELLAAQKRVIALQDRVDKMTPKNAPDHEIIWHIFAGVFSQDAAESDDLQTVRKYLKWINAFGKKHIKPYVNPRVYAECSIHMTRGLVDRISELETQKLLKDMEKRGAKIREDQQLARQN